VNIEANKKLIAEFEQQRPLDKNVNVAVSTKEGEAILFKYDDWSGRNTISMKEVEIVGQTIGMRIQSHEVVQTKTLNQIVNEYCDGHFPEFLNCDLEGLDFDVLSQADFSKGSPVVICVEVQRNRQEILQMLAEKDFYAYVTLGENILFVRGFYLYTLKKAWPRWSPQRKEV
jgi:FkbM family methyltransferase